MADNETKPKAAALVGGLIAAALLDKLFEKGILTLDESRDVLQSALRSNGPHIQSPEGFEASQILGSLIRAKNPKR